MNNANQELQTLLKISHFHPSIHSEGINSLAMDGRMEMADFQELFKSKS
jgi:hypothetical protein